ncbi:hypothetical protein [Luteimonas sp. FCS-9]|uniref:hypothetical protein n=1 Tax=Luteimonas sp. FCS-9 TaxID=1547516 RepID=UPI00063E94AB|nr:hypothetical protein [Luteimonas sp. FCS-9]KLJ00727.1 hypothetical protein WQ56_07985 [Luteimonas sp. FCS-9]
MNIRFALIAALAITATPAAFAQDGSATLRVDRGSAMTSTGGEFAAAPSGSQVGPGTRVMLAENSRATLVYPDGCTQPLSAAGVYSVPATCVAAAGTSGATGTMAGGEAAATVGIVAGTMALVGVGLHNMDEEPAPPISR